MASAPGIMPGIVGKARRLTASLCAIGVRTLASVEDRPKLDGPPWAERLTKEFQMNKRAMLTYAISASLFGSAFGLALAGDPGMMHEKSDARGRAMQEERFNAMAERLNLTADQKKAFEAAMKEKGDKMRALHEEFMARRKKIAEDYAGKTKAILNEKQRAEFEKMRAEDEKRREEFRSRGKDEKKPD
jgi:hypothetical protein